GRGRRPEGDLRARGRRHGVDVPGLVPVLAVRPAGRLKPGNRSDREAHGGGGTSRADHPASAPPPPTGSRSPGPPGHRGPGLRGSVAARSWRPPARVSTSTPPDPDPTRPRPARIRAGPCAVRASARAGAASSAPSTRHTAVVPALVTGLPDAPQFRDSVIQ